MNEYLGNLIADALEAERYFSLDELEEFANKRRKLMTDLFLTKELKVGDVVIVVNPVVTKEYKGRTGVVTYIQHDQGWCDVKLHGDGEEREGTAENIDLFEGEVKSFKIGVKTSGDHGWVFNTMRFKTEDAASLYGNNLAYRWTAVQSWCVIATTDEPTEEINA